MFEIFIAGLVFCSLIGTVWVLYYNAYITDAGISVLDVILAVSLGLLWFIFFVTYALERLGNIYIVKPKSQTMKYPEGKDQ